jgi:S-adenosylmethionine/arginine decarboxylase-like enzyme
MSYWGYHLIADFGKCVPASIRCRRNIIRFSNTLVKEIDMVPYGEPSVEHFGEGNKSGFTLVQLIQTSNICAHFVEETNDIYLDVFSCKPFDPKVVERVTSLYFAPKVCNRVFLQRQAPKVPIENELIYPKPLELK